MTLYQFISKVFETKHTSQVLSMFYHVHVPQEFGCHFTLTCIHLIPIFFLSFLLPDPRTRSGATARRQEAVKARRAAEERRLAELRQRERRKQYENRRFGFPRGALPDPPDLPNSFQQLAPTDFILIQDTPVDVSLADVEDILRQVNETPLDTRREFLPPAVSSFLDNHVARGMRERGFMTDTRRRQYDVAMYGINNRVCALFHRCNVCRLFSYPFATDLHPEDWTIQCNTCFTRVHRHCQETCRPFSHDHFYQCNACADGIDPNGIVPNPSILL